ncbi:MAG: hypothetical protein JWN04_6488 [Myxococcaceae bacterium]|nr:hypothetical protein [Myxococcaceae bacterium]
MTQLLALGGDAASAPRDTFVAYWAALAAGADGLIASLRCTADGRWVCCSPRVPALSGSLDELATIDAGAYFQAGTPNRESSSEHPTGKSVWAQGPDRPALRFPELGQLLRTFGRRTKLYLQPETRAPRAFAGLAVLLESLESFGLLHRTLLIVDPKTGAELASRHKLRWVARFVQAPSDDELRAARECHAAAVALPASAARDLRVSESAERCGLPVWLWPEDDRSDRPTDPLAARLDDSRIATVVTSAVLRTREVLRPSGVVFADSLRAEKLDGEHWAAGFSHPNLETRMSASTSGFCISIQQGSSYSGGGLVLKLPIPGDFDAQVAFAVSKPQQATTFELAAMAIEPAGLLLDPAELDPKHANLAFDVHGAPPYASSERDEDDGFRFGWNNSSNLTRISDDWRHDSANMYNRYSRDVGDGRARGAWTTGRLRLVRGGQVFASYFVDDDADDWVCSGVGLVSTMPADAFIRLAAKHWHKSGEPPANEVRFSDFVVRQS